MRIIRSTLFDIYLVLWTLAMSPAVPVIMLRGSPVRSVRTFAAVWIGGVIVGLKYIAGISHREIGRENIPVSPCLFVANHQSPWETIVAAALVPEIAIVAKTELLRIPVFGWALHHYPMIMLDREGGGTALKKMVADSRAALAKGRSILIFPEGTRKSVSARIEFRRGFELLYRALAVPVVPVALNSGLVWGPDRPYKSNGVITISYLPPVPSDIPASQMSEMVRSAIQTEKDALAREGAPEARLAAVG